MFNTNTNTSKTKTIFFDSINNNKEIDDKLKNIIIRYGTIENIDLGNINNVRITYPFLIIESTDDILDANISYNLEAEKNNIIKHFKDELDTIKTAFGQYKQNIDNLKNIKTIDDLNIPANFIRIQSKIKFDDKEYISFGDILYTGFDVFDNKLLLNYVKIPLKCCKEINLTYNDLEPLFEFKPTEDAITYQIYQHPLYNTFKIFKKEGEEIEKSLPLYEIIPCVEDVSTYQTKIKKYNELKQKCEDRGEQQFTSNSLDSFNKLQNVYKINEIKDNEKILNKLRKESNELQREINRKNIVKTEFNRAKLQKYNNKKSIEITKLTEKLSNNKLDINVLYSSEIIKYLKEQCKNGKISFCKKDNDTKNKLLNKLEELEKDIEKTPKTPSKTQKENDEEIKIKLLEIIKECPSVDNLIHKDELNKCYQCNL